MILFLCNNKFFFLSANICDNKITAMGIKEIFLPICSVLFIVLLTERAVKIVPHECTAESSFSASLKCSGPAKSSSAYLYFPIVDAFELLQETPTGRTN